MAANAGHCGKRRVGGPVQQRMGPSAYGAHVRVLPTAKSESSSAGRPASCAIRGVEFGRDSPRNSSSDSPATAAVARCASCTRGSRSSNPRTTAASMALCKDTPPKRRPQITTPTGTQIGYPIPISGSSAVGRSFCTPRIGRYRTLTYERGIGYPSRHGDCLPLSRRSRGCPT
jgi:hypothetical protein